MRTRSRQTGAPAPKPPPANPEPPPPSLPPLNLNAAGLDIGARDIWVALPPGRAPESVRAFGTFTPDLRALADWLQQWHIDTVALESTGVYWIPIYNLLEERGLRVYLVNPLQLKRAPGRKSDVQDCQWLQQLHCFGLLSPSFRPPDDIRVLRTLVRQRTGLIEDRAVTIQHMHQALQQMNLQLGLVVSDITGVTGLGILRAIVGGERDPGTLAHQRDRRCHSSAATLAKALQGDYRAELVFVLKQALVLYDCYTQQLADCDAEIERHLATLTPASVAPTGTPAAEPAAEPAAMPAQPPPAQHAKAKSHSKNAPGPQTPQALARVAGVDLLALPGFNASTAQTLLAEIGPAMTSWPSEKHFCSWLGLAPHNDISGGKVLRSRTLPTANRAGQALRLAAQAAGRGHSAVGAYYQRLKGQKGAGPATVATAHKLARLVYHMLKEHRPYKEVGADAYTQAQHDRALKHLRRQAEALGYTLTPQPEPPPPPPPPSEPAATPATAASTG